MLFFVRNAAALQIVILMMAYGWIDGGTRPDLLLSVIPWLGLFVAEMLLVFPQAKSTETLHEARQRVWHSVSRDPFLYIALAFTLYLTIPMFNVAGCPVFDRAARAWVNPEAPVPWLPSCCIPSEQASLLLWFPPVFAAVLAARHALLKRGRRIVLHGFCWNAAALALFGFIQLATGAKSIYWVREELPGYFFSTFGYPNFGGAFFTLAFAVSLGLWFGNAMALSGLCGPLQKADLRSGDVHEKIPLWRYNVLLIPVFLNGLAAIGTLSRAAIMLSVVVAVVYGLYALAASWQCAKVGLRLKIISATFIVLLVGVCGLTAFSPKSLADELKTIDTEAVMERLNGKAAFHTRLAGAIARDHAALGVGGWGYIHYQQQYYKEFNVTSPQIVGGVNVHNDFMQFLAEFGWVGTTILLAFLLGLPGVFLFKLIRYMMSLPAKKVGVYARPYRLFALPPETLAILIGGTATVVHSFGDLPFRNPAVLLFWCCAWVCADGFIPKVVRRPSA